MKFLMLATDKENNGGWSLQQGLLKKDGKIFVGSAGGLRQQIIKEIHGSSFGGHSGRDVTLKRVSQFFYLPTMTTDFEQHVKKCDICHMNKSESVSYLGLLQPLPIPNQVWEDISMDFIEGLSRSRGKDTILVVVDQFSKYSHFIALTHPFSSMDVAQAFLDNVYKYHGLPKTIVSD